MTIATIIKIILNEKDRNKTQGKEMMHNAIIHYPLTDAQSVPRQQLVPSLLIPPVYTEHDVL